MRTPRSLLVAATAGLFLVWSNSFVAIGFLLGSEHAPARLDWVGLSTARFLLAAPVCAVYAMGRHRRASAEILRFHWRRLVPAAVLAVPVYNLALSYGQEHGVPAPIASLTTALLPLFVLALAAVFLGERLTRVRVIGFLVAAAGMTLIALARRDEMGEVYSLLVLLVALAPLSWSLYSVISKPLTGQVPPLPWTYLTITLGSVLLLPLGASRTWEQLRVLDAPGWLALSYLAFPCTVLGWAVWTWLLKHLPASTVGMSVFLNPPMTTLSKLILAGLAPGVFVFSIRGQEILGGVLALLGLFVAVVPGIRARAGRG